MEKRIIKNTDLSISPINIGGNVFGWTLDEKASFNILNAFFEKDINFIDTADIYSWWANNSQGGESETIIGKWHKERKNRHDLVIATKVGSPIQQFPARVHKSHILSAANASLKRLQTDYIDLYYTHFDNEETPVEETMIAYAELIQSGKVRYIATSNMSPERIIKSMEVAENLGIAKYIALQPHYNLMERKNYEENYLPLVEKYNLSVFPYFALASGFLTGKYRSEADFGKSSRGAGMAKYMNEKGLSILSALDKVAAKHGVQLSSVAIAWLLAQPSITAPIASATSENQILGLMEAINLNLDVEDLNLINQASL